MDPVARIVVIGVLSFIVFAFCVTVFLGVSLWQMNRQADRETGHRAERERSREFYRRRRGW
jgi:hypothetical protein